jgi:hypothetical protein
MTMTDLAKQLELIAAHAPKLRDAGVQSLSIEGISMVLAPPDPPTPTDTPGDPKSTRDLDDAVTYGLPDGADIPGFRRPDGL